MIANTDVIVRGMNDKADAELAKAAGFGVRHHGYTVTRYDDDGAAVVALWND